MSIQNKDWYAQDDKMPGVNTLKVSGIVTAPNSATTVALVRSAVPATFNHLCLDLKLENQGIGAQVLTDKKVTYTQPSGASITGVSIFYNGELLASISDVQITH